MWLITHATTGSRFYFDADKQNYTVGRLGADLELQADICVSRSHAVFHVTESHMELEDLGSKYGTFHNLGIEKNTTMDKGRKVKLKVNDLIRFGRLQNVWKVEKLTFNTVTSALAKEDVDQVTANVNAVGGKVLSQWSTDCTHLTMKDPSVTVKLLHALVDQKCVVAPKYWKDLAAAIAGKKADLPNPELYCPDFGDTNIDVGCKPERRNLFKGTTFVFLSRKHFDMYGPIVNAAGGSCKDINSGVQKAFLIKKNVVVIQYNPSTQTQSSQTISTIAEFLQSRSKRIIPEYEIGLAILNCSIEEYCNPTFKMPESMPQTVPINPNPDNSMTVDLTDGESTPGIDTQSLDIHIPETNDILVTSTPYENPVPCIEAVHDVDEDDQETMPNMHITETPVAVANRKRKHGKVLSIVSEESDNDDDELFEFAKKVKKNVKDQIKAASPKSSAGTSKHDNVGGEEFVKPDDRNTEKSTRNVVEEKSTNPKGKTIKKSAFSDFLEKTQNKNKCKASSPPKDSEDLSSSTSRGARKRPRIQVLGEDNDNNENEEDDLFCFGDSQTNKKKRNEKQKSNNEDGDDLFGFKEKESDHIVAPDEDSNDLQATETFIATKPAKSSSYITMPKPKILPRKMSAIDWISDCFCKVNIKNEMSSILKSEEEHIKTEFDAKLNIDDLQMTEDHRKWLESLNNAIEIQEISLNLALKLNEKSHYKSSNQHNLNETLSGSTRNFKMFAKKFQASEKNSTMIQLHVR